MVIQFDEESHSYKGLVDGKLKSLLNASTFKKVYTPEFNSGMVSNMAARNSEFTAKEIEKSWNLKGKASRNYGSGLHETLEGFIKYKSLPEDLYLKRFLQSFMQLKLGEVESERLAGNAELLIGGLIDLDSESTIYDLKTGNFLKKKQGNLKAPFDFLPNNPLGQATLQLNFYRLFEGNEDKELKVLFWNGEEFEIIELEKFDLDIIRKEIKEYYIMKEELKRHRMGILAMLRGWQKELGGEKIEEMIEEMEGLIGEDVKK